MGPNPTIPKDKPKVPTGSCPRDLVGGGGAASTISLAAAVFNDCKELLLGRGGLPIGYDLLAMFSDPLYLVGFRKGFRETLQGCTGLSNCAREVCTEICRTVNVHVFEETYGMCGSSLLRRYLELWLCENPMGRYASFPQNQSPNG
jgi:hypothetical protein